MLASPAIMGPSTSPGGSAQELHSVERSDCRKELGSGRSGLLPQTYHSTIHHLSQKAMAMSGQQTLYERIGGAAAVDQLVDRFYGRVLAMKQNPQHHAGANVQTTPQRQNHAVIDDHLTAFIGGKCECIFSKRKRHVDSNNFQWMLTRQRSADHIKKQADHGSDSTVDESDGAVICAVEPSVIPLVGCRRRRNL